MADSTQIVFYGLNGLENRTVAAFIAGLDCGDYTVSATGTITVPFLSDPDDLFTLAYIVALSATGPPLGPPTEPAGTATGGWGPIATSVRVISGGVPTDLTIPVVIGLVYSSRGQILRPLDEQGINSPQGPGLGMMRRFHQISALVDSSIGHATGGVMFGTNFTDTYIADYRDSAGTPLTQGVMFSGVYWSSSIQDASSYDGMLCWEIDRPYPTTIVAIGGALQVEEPV